MQLTKTKKIVILIALLTLQFFAVTQVSNAQTVSSQTDVSSSITVTPKPSGSNKDTRMYMAINNNQNGITGTSTSITYYLNDDNSNEQNNISVYLMTCDAPFNYNATTTLSGHLCPTGAIQQAKVYTGTKTRNGNYVTQEGTVAMNPSKYYMLLFYAGNVTKDVYLGAGFTATTCNVSKQTTDNVNTIQLPCNQQNVQLTYYLNTDTTFTPPAPYQMPLFLNITQPNYAGSPYSTSTPLLVSGKYYDDTSSGVTKYACFGIFDLTATFFENDPSLEYTKCETTPSLNGTNDFNSVIATSTLSTFLQGKSYGIIGFFNIGTSTFTTLDNTTGEMAVPVPIAFGTSRPNDLDLFYEQFSQFGTSTTPQGWTCEVDLLVTGFDICLVSYKLFIPQAGMTDYYWSIMTSEMTQRIPFAYISDLQVVFQQFNNNTGATAPPSLNISFWGGMSPIQLFGTTTQGTIPDATRTFLKTLISAVLFVGFGFSIYSLRNKLFK